MGKRQHQKDKMYVTYTEWSQFYGGKKVENAENEHVKFKRLPFDHCTITMIPFETPYCDSDGNIFELNAVIEFLKQFKVNPITGKPFDAKGLIKLNFSKNNDDEYFCPSLFKPFTKNSHIVAIATTGNVFCYEAVEQLNIKTKNWKDLVDDTPFTRKDIITIQDPNDLNKFNITTFHHIRKNLRVETEEEKLERKDPHGRLKTISAETKDILNELERDYKPEARDDTAGSSPSMKADKFNSAHYSTGTVAASFTSTAMVPVSKHEVAILDDQIVRYERVKKKGYVRFTTSHGPLNLELHCEIVPKTCENFMRHCKDGYYNGTIFHRSIKNFMIQGGDPTKSGYGGKSIWDEKFEDEIKPNLTHAGRGVLSMANSGPNTNGSQFFITYRSCRSLDGKHTVFGRIVGGMDTLSEMEKIEVDNKDRPIEDIVVLKTDIFVDPYQEADDALKQERADELKKDEVAKIEAQKKITRQPKVVRSGIGKYLSQEALPSKSTAIKTKTVAPTETEIPTKKKRIDGFGNFDGW